MDFLAFEPQFLDHAAPVWLAMPESTRGRFLVDVSLMERAALRGIDAEPIDAGAVRASSRVPKANPGEGPMAFVVSIGDTKVGRRLGYRRFAYMEHGAGQAYIGQRGMAARQASYAGGIDREDTELFLVPNEYAANLWREAYPDARVEVIGSPRLDTLPARRIDPIAPAPTIAISFHWPAFVAPESDTALGHYLAALPDLANRFHLIGHAHPKGDWPQRMARLYRRAGIEFVPDFDEVCRRADLYVCDNSSTIFEFASTGRPVVLLNSPYYRRDVHHGLRFWSAAHVGLQVDQPRDLVPTIARTLEDSGDLFAAREDALSIVYAYRTGAAERAARAIEAWASVPLAAFGDGTPWVTHLGEVRAQPTGATY